MKSLKQRIVVFIALFSLVFVSAVHTTHANDNYQQAEIYFNEACGECVVYLQNELIPILESLDITDIQMKDYINDRSFRQELNQYTETYGIPFDFQSHIMTFINTGNLILGGHVPEQVVRDLFLNQDRIPLNLLVYQDVMGGTTTNYQVWTPGAPSQEYALDEPIATYLDWHEANNHQFKTFELNKREGLLGLVLLTGFLDGINPCAIAVLIFFIAFLFTLRSSLKKIFLYGFIYIAVIYLTYLGIGFGLFKAIVFSGTPHLMAKIGAWLVLSLGVINIIGYYYPRFPIKLQIPKFSQKALKHWLTIAMPSAVVVGAFLVGLCTFPCSGGIYVAIIGLLAARGTFFQGLGYMLIYNLMFVLPLILLLILASNRNMLGRVAEWQSKSTEGFKLWGGLVMIALGVIILIWFI